MNADKKPNANCRSIGPQRIALVLLGALGLGALAVRAADRYVATNALSIDPYTSWENAASNIQDAVNVAAGGETVWVSNGSYRLTNQIMVTNNITVRSVNGYSNTSVYADWPAYANRCLYVANTGMVDGFSVSNGHVIGGGGGGAYLTSSGVIQNCNFVNNYASNNVIYDSLGGGAYIYDGIVAGCRFYSNSFFYGGASGYAYGGAIGIRKGSILNCILISNFIATGSGTVLGEGIGCVSGTADRIVISNCSVAWHRSSSGEGMTINANYALITDCVASNNQIGFRTDGGVYRNCVAKNNYWLGVWTAWGGNFTNCTIINNNPGIWAAPGGGLVVFDKCIITNNSTLGCDLTNTSVTMRNCLIAWNRGSVNGGGLRLYKSAKAYPGVSGIFNCTIVSNSTTKDGGGIYTIGPSNNIVNCVIASNRATGGAYQDICNTNDPSNTNNYYNSICNDTNTGLFALSQGNLTNDPIFVNPAADNWRLANSSPGINTGTNQSWMTNSFDLDGRPRLRYGTVDMGAYEKINEATVYNFR